ncbi:glutathione S-transferase family protein [Dongia sp.]|uniref:glutathione S-transferase family protein n=1 Tax=Dongia sp. TaxID=1977262 RepID=UPI003753880E
MYKLYWAPGSAAMAPQAILNALNVKHELIKVDDDKNEQKSAEYMRLNPHGRVPTLVYDGAQVMYESAAICLFLTERHPEAGLAPAPGHPDRGLFLQWMAYQTNTLQEALMHYWHGNYFIDGVDQQAQLSAKAEQRVDEMFGFLDGVLARSGPWLCGKNFYACDIYLAMMARWTRKMEKPAVHHREIKRLVQHCLALPAYAKMLKDQGIEQTA